VTDQRTSSGRTTIQDVARAAGVSVTTVSHALNGKGSLSPATRERVVAVARTMQYQPHPVAAGLRRGRTGVLGLDIRPLDTLGDYAPAGVDHFLRLAGAAAVTAMSRGYGMMLVPDLSRGTQPVDSLAVDGYILSDPVHDDPVLGALLTQGRPVVTVGRDTGRPEFEHWVNTDDAGTAEEVLDLLWRRGARRPALVVGTDANSWNHDVEETYRSWCARRGLPVDVHAVPERAGVDGGARLAAALLTRATPPDAIFCQTGRHAAGVCAAAVAQGLSVPGDLLVVGGSDSEHTRLARPPITAVDLKPEELGRAAVEMLLQLVSGEPVEPGLLRPEVIERGSTEQLPA
jgi:DNA-binding LacI/PurR family transcriptional regulator